MTFVDTKRRGFSLVELLVSVAILAILMATAVPSFIDYFDRARLRGAADNVASMIAVVRSEAVKRSRDVSVSMGGTAANWCIGANEAATPAVAAAYAASDTCDCVEADECFVDDIRRVVNAGSNSGVTADGVTTSFVIDGKLGNVSGLAESTFKLTSPRGSYQVQLNISPLGQTRICVPSGKQAISGYPSC